jgi:hypothetical protein
MPNGHIAGECFYDVFGIEVVTYMAQCPMRVELMSVIRDHTNGFLSPVLQGVQAKGCMGGCVRMAVYTKNTTFIVEVIVVIV